MVYSIIAHDLRSPFNGLMGLSELLLQNFDGFSNEKKKSSIHSIHQSSTTLNSLLENLLGWSKIQTGKLDISQTPIELKPLVNEVIELLSDVALKKEITLVNNIDDNIKVYANLYMISTVVGI